MSLLDLSNHLLSVTEWIMLFLIIGGGLFLMIRSRLLPYRYFRHAIAITMGKYDKEEDPGEVKHYEALASAIAATVGLGNISGVAIAIYMGGPGVVFWMWLTAIIGMCIKFYSCSLAVMFRRQESKGKVQGGPMYYMTLGLGSWAKPLAVLFCLAGLIGVLPAFTTNQLTQTLMEVVNPDENLFAMGEFAWRLAIGIVLTLITAWVVFGGLKSIVKTSTALVPIMVLLYLGATIFILIANYTDILPSLGLIFTEAFTPTSMAHGTLWGLILLGVRRAVFSNESGVGNAPMYHGQSKTQEPVQEGLVGMLGPFIDTVLVCTLTALVILVSGAYLETETNGIAMTLMAFERALYGVGDVLLLVLVVTFALSTLFTYSYYGVKCLTFLTNKRIGKTYNVVYVLSITFAAVVSVDLVVNMIDLAFAVMSIPNMVAVLLLSPHIGREMKRYFNKYRNART